MLKVYLLYTLIVSFGHTDPATTFRFHSSQEPTSVDPAAIHEPTGGFLFYNLYRGFYRLNQSGQLVSELGQTCEWKESDQMQLKCVLRRDAKFSNGEIIRAQHWIKSWQRLLAKGSRSPHSELLINIKNVAEILAGQKSESSMGVTSRNDFELNIEFSKPDPEFLYKLALPALTPLFENPPDIGKADTHLVTNGPYKISGWIKKTKLLLTPNPHYLSHSPQHRPDVEMWIIEDDNSALQLYDLKKLDFLRRLNVIEIKNRKKGKDFFFIPTLRFDYLGFGPGLRKLPKLREALSLSLNFPELTKAYQTPGQVGCPSLPQSMSTPFPCLRFNLKKARSAWQKLQPEQQMMSITLSYSKNGGDDLARGMEWMQAQWKKNLGAKIVLRPLEFKTFLSELKHPDLGLFRKGVNLDRPTCNAALENFTSHNSENLIGLQNIAFDHLVTNLSRPGQTPTQQTLECGKGLKMLTDDYALVPMGEIYFAMLARPSFKGWYLTRLQQLDLTDLTPSSSN